MFSESLWEQWCAIESQKYQEYTENGKTVRKYLKKGYLHFDNRVWFPKEFKSIKRILADPKKIVSHQFSPFLKLVVKTPRYRKLEDGVVNSKGKNYTVKTKSRPLCYASHLDSLIFGYYAFALNTLYQNYIRQLNISDAVLAYRTDLKKCNIQFAKEAFDHIKVNHNCVAIAIDITGYFDNIDHDILKKKWEKIIKSKLPEDQYKIFRTITKYSYCGKNNILKHFRIDLESLKDYPQNLLSLIPQPITALKFRYLMERGLIVINDKPSKKTKRPAGIPQGSPISAVLSNIYLVDFDYDMSLLSMQNSFIYRRYCDDILIICDPTQAQFVVDNIMNKLQRDYFLSINPNKLEVIGFKHDHTKKLRGYDLTIPHSQELLEVGNAIKYKSLQYLGFDFNGHRVIIRPSSLSRYFSRMKRKVARVVRMAYSPNARDRKLFISQLLHRYTHLGKRNFLTYSYNAAAKNYSGSDGTILEGMDSKQIRAQLSRHVNILEKTVVSRNFVRYATKLRQNKMPTFKRFK